MKSIKIIWLIIQHIRGNLKGSRLDWLYIEFLKQPAWFKLFRYMEKIAGR